MALGMRGCIMADYAHSRVRPGMSLEQVMDRSGGWWRLEIAVDGPEKHLGDVLAGDSGYSYHELGMEKRLFLSDQKSLIGQLRSFSANQKSFKLRFSYLNGPNRSGFGVTFDAEGKAQEVTPVYMSD